MGKCGDTTIEVNTPADLAQGVPSSVPCTTPCTPDPNSCPTVCVPQGVPNMSCNPCGPKPYYTNPAPLCPESNKQVVSITQISGVIKLLAASAMPACGASVRMVFSHVQSIGIGSWLWAQGIGFLEVVSFNPYTGEIELRNICPEGCDQAAAGTPIPACTLFTISAPQCGVSSGGSSDCPKLAADMVSPANGGCVEIAVTEVTGLVVGKNVAITSGEYRVDAILSPTLIRVCNDGAGLPQGTIIFAEDGNGNLIICIILIDTNPCTFPEVLEGRPLVCLNGFAQPIVGTESGQILVYDDGTGNSSFRTLGIPVADCTTLTTCLTLDPNLPPGTEYLVEVVDTSAYIVGQLVIILGRTFEITQILNGTQMRILPLPDPVVIENYPAGAQLCSADCCTELQNQIDDIVVDITNINSELAGIQTTANGGAVLGAIAADITALGTNVVGQTMPLFSLMNSSSTRTMVYLMVVNFTAQVSVDTTGVWEYSAEEQIDGGGWVPFSIGNWGPYGSITATNWTFTATMIGGIPTGTTKDFEYRHRIRTLVGAAGPSTWVAGNIGANGISTTD